MGDVAVGAGYPPVGAGYPPVGMVSDTVSDGGRVESLQAGCEVK
jgi:hypothetical protein